MPEYTENLPIPAKEVIMKIAPHPSNAGYDCLLCAAEIAAEQGVFHQSRLSSELYPQVARRLGLSYYQVSKGISRATKEIRECPESLNALQEMLHKNFLSDLTSGDLIFYIAYLSTGGKVREE